jgi:hypothetical protein
MDVCTYDVLGGWRACPPLMKTLRNKNCNIVLHYKTKQDNMCHLKTMYIKLTIT